MSHCRANSVFVCSLCLILTPLTAQQASPPTISTQAPQRDPQALAVLNQALAVTGGAQVLGQVQDFTATGSIIYFWAGEQVQGSVTLRGRTTDQFRFDAALSIGTRSWAVSNGEGSIRETDGTTLPIPNHNAINLGSLTFPIFTATSALQNASATVIDLGLVSTSDHQARWIRVQQTLPLMADPSWASKVATKDFFIDSSTLQIVKIQDMIHPPQNFIESYPHEILFSDYRLVNGVLTPFTIIETVNGQHTWTVQINQISFNTGLTDSDFQL